VFGRILQLIEVPDHRYLQAIEHVAGGRLANIVVTIKLSKI
jgi:chromosome segregation ATPase